MGDDRRVVVIGSGPSGAIAASTLIAAGMSVTMLESGEQMPAGLLIRARSRTLLRARFGRPDASPYTHVAARPASWFHVRVPGGLSNYWTGAVPRFAPGDFCEGGRVHDRYVWPVTYADLMPYYERLEAIIGVTGIGEDVAGLPAPVARHLVRLPDGWERAAALAASFGQALVPVPLAEGSPWMATARSTAFNSFQSLVTPLRQSPRFRLRLGAHVLRLEWDASQSRVTSVTYFDRADRSERYLPAAAVVVAAGPLESTRILLSSTSDDFPAGLGNTRDILGRYLHDHVHDVSLVEFDRALPRPQHTINLTRRPYDEGDPLLGALATIGNSRLSKADRVRNLTTASTRRLGLTIFGTMVPVAENRVTLHRDARDAFGLPLLELDVGFDATAIQNVTHARERAGAVLEGLGRARIRPLVERHTPGHAAHYGGTVRMHASPNHGMLDGWNRLHAVRNVVVADASAFTTGPEKNPTLTAMALSARAAERLARDLMSGSSAGPT
jgi:choline dehydrogenase-like flavoprotein